MALVIGNGTYQSTSPLRNPVNDAKAVSVALRGLGFQVDEALDLDRNAMRDALGRFGSAASGADVALLYYAGHGVQVAGTNYLVPVDIRVSNEQMLVIDAISVTDIVKALEQASPRATVIILDACRDNPFATASRAIGRGLASIEAPVGTLIAYSTSPGAIAEDGEGSNSAYTQALVDVLGVPGLSLEALFRNVRIQVLKSTQSRQKPWEESSLTSDVILNEGNTTGSPTSDGSTQPSDAEVNPAMIGHEDAVRFVRYVNSHAATEDLASFVARSYATTVDYYDKGLISADMVLDDKRNWFRRWSDWSITADETSVVLKPLDGTRYRLEYSFSYQFVGKAGTADAGKKLKGRATAIRTILRRAGDIVILSENTQRLD